MNKMQPLAPDVLKPVRLIATDMDGTLTLREKFAPALLQTLADLAAVNIPVLIVTGRSAGWVSGLVHYLPIAGAIAENGGLLYLAAPASKAELLVLIGDVIKHRYKLAQMFERLQVEFPQLRESDDNQFRVTDWTFDVRGLTVEELQQIGELCQVQGWGFTYSTVQCHIKPLNQEKAIGLKAVLNRYFPGITPDQTVTVGDSPNDQSLFDSRQFPLSVGVANIRDYAAQMLHLPAYITPSAEIAGFCELAALLIKLKTAV